MKHYIIVKFMDEADTGHLIPDIKRLFDRALRLDGVEAVAVYPASRTGANRYSLMIEMTLTPEGLERFDASDIHREWKSVYGEKLASKAIFDRD